jgi:hypothetical protein
VLAAASVARDVLASASPERIWTLSDEEVADCIMVLGQLATGVDANLVAVLAEAKRRSLGAGDGWGPVDWARAKAPGLSARKLLDLNTVAGVADERRMAEVVDAVAQGAGEDQSNALPVEKAAQIVRFHQGVRGMADPDELESGTAILLHSARGHDGLSEKQLATALRHAADVMRPDRLVEHDADVRRAHRSLVKSRGPMGMSRYTMMLDEEGAAVLDAAIDVLAKPKPDEDTGNHDSRTPAARRADALLDLVTRAVGAPDGVPRQAKTSLVVTIGLDVLQGRCRGGGLTMTGDLLTVETVRRMACDAQLIPMVLGSNGEVLDQGMAARLFNRAQIRHLWMRDRHCTFPGCSKPCGWADAHHLIHWLDDGPTDIWNAALLCRAHHTVVHSNRYAGEVVYGPRGPSVQWDLTPGSYATRLAAWRASRAAAGAATAGAARAVAVTSAAPCDHRGGEALGASGPPRP